MTPKVNCIVYKNEIARRLILLAIVVFGVNELMA